MAPEVLALWPEDPERTGEKTERKEVLGKREEAPNRGFRDPPRAVTSHGEEELNRLESGADRESITTEGWSGPAAQTQPAQLSPTTKLAPSTTFTQEPVLHNTI